MLDIIEQPKSKRGGKRPGSGRKKGSRNRIPLELKESILEAAKRAGGPDGIVGYLEAQAIANAGAFMTLLGKVLPMQVAGADGGPVEIIVRWLDE
jgi:hypothetical protein